MLWLLVALLIPLLSIYGRPVQHWVAANIGYTVAAWIISISLTISIALLINVLSRQSSRLPYYHLMWFLPLFLLFPFMLERVEERVHFLTFGAFGALSLLFFSPLAAFVLCIGFSGTDELLQYYLPDRVGDWRDVGFNSLASLSAALFTGLWLKGGNRG